MKQILTMGSLFDGSGGFPLAGAVNGIVPIWASEIEPYPIAVTRSRFPHMRHLGNVIEIDGGKNTHKNEAITAWNARTPILSKREMEMLDESRSD